MVKQAAAKEHDIFLSHAYADRELVLGIALTIEDLGYSVYIDWRDDPQLDRTHVTAATAATLRQRLKSCRCLFYSITDGASESKWMPWELGFKDADNSRVAILPITDHATDYFNGQQYLGLYPYVTSGNSREGQRKLWVQESPTCYIHFDAWVLGIRPIQH